MTLPQDHAFATGLRARIRAHVARARAGGQVRRQVMGHGAAGMETVVRSGVPQVPPARVRSVLAPQTCITVIPQTRAVIIRNAQADVPWIPKDAQRVARPQARPRNVHPLHITISLQVRLAIMQTVRADATMTPKGVR